MSYQCPDCSATRSSEERIIEDKVLVLTVKYEGGCFIKFNREGNIWKLVNQVCIKNLKLNRK